jgi:hypothetical protein
VEKKEVKEMKVVKEEKVEDEGSGALSRFHPSP